MKLYTHAISHKYTADELSDTEVVFLFQNTEEVQEKVAVVKGWTAATARSLQRKGILNPVHTWHIPDLCLLYTSIPELCCVSTYFMNGILQNYERDIPNF